MSGTIEKQNMKIDEGVLIHISVSCIEYHLNRLSVSEGVYLFQISSIIRFQQFCRHRRSDLLLLRSMCGRVASTTNVIVGTQESNSFRGRTIRNVRKHTVYVAG